MNNNRIEAIRAEVRKQIGRSAWEKGVETYAMELLDGLEEAIEGGWFEEEDLISRRMTEKAMLNGAEDWFMYSYGGCSLIYNSDIAKRLCTPSELRKTRNGERRPNSYENWLDVQNRALIQASWRVLEAVSRLNK